MTLPTAVLAYHVLKSANISNEKQQLARATITELNYKNMKKQLKAIHDSNSWFVGKTFNHAVLDTGCTKTACGESWLNNYIDTLSTDDKQKVVRSKSDTRFKFGDGNTVQAIKEVKILAEIGNKEVDIHTDVINNELPSLLSKDAMKRADTTIGFTKDKINILGQETDMKFTSGGHYLIPISKSYKALNDLMKTIRRAYYYLLKISAMLSKIT